MPVFLAANLEIAPVLLSLFVIPAAAKVIGCGVGAWGKRYREMAHVGIGMVPRGEVGILVAQIRPRSDRRDTHYRIA